MTSVRLLLGLCLVLVVQDIGRKEVVKALWKWPKNLRYLAPWGFVLDRRARVRWRGWKHLARFKAGSQILQPLLELCDPR